MLSPTVDLPVALCGCGCGGVTNRRQLLAQLLHDDGWTDSVIGSVLGMRPESVKKLRLRQPAKWLPGHRLLPDGVPCKQWLCPRCGAPRRMSVEAYERHYGSTGHSLPRSCGRFECNAMASGRSGRLWRSILRDVTQRHPGRHDLGQIESWEARAAEEDARTAEALRVDLERLRASREERSHLRRLRRMEAALDGILEREAKRAWATEVKRR